MKQLVGLRAADLTHRVALLQDLDGAKTRHPAPSGKVARGKVVTEEPPISGPTLRKVDAFGLPEMLQGVRSHVCQDPPDPRDV